MPDGEGPHRIQHGVGLPQRADDEADRHHQLGALRSNVRAGE